jgi:hypothetical protein
VKIKLDENVPLRLAAMLEGHGHHVDTVQQEGLTGRPDPDIAAAASAAGRMVVTVDRGFPAFAGRDAEHSGVIVSSSPTRTPLGWRQRWRSSSIATRWMIWSGAPSSSRRHGSESGARNETCTRRCRPAAGPPPLSIRHSSRSQVEKRPPRRVGSDERGWVVLDLDADQLVLDETAFPFADGLEVLFARDGEVVAIEVANCSTGQVGRHALPLREGFFRPLRELAEEARVLAETWPQRKPHGPSLEAMIDELRQLEGDERRRAWERLKRSLGVERRPAPRA